MYLTKNMKNIENIFFFLNIRIKKKEHEGKGTQKFLILRLKIHTID